MALRSALAEKGSRAACSMLGGRRLLFSPVQTRNSTIVLDSSSDLEIIEASIRESPCEFDWIRTPRAARVRHKNVSSARSPLEVPKRRQSSIASTSPGKHITKRRKISDHLQVATESPLAIALPLESPVPGEALNAGSKTKTPPVQNYLAGSKRRNVDAWLTSTAQRTRPAQPKECDSPIDPKVAEVLQLIYGNAWLKKAIKKCKTDVKAPPPTKYRLLASETKDIVSNRDCSLGSPKISKPARRKIFDSPQIRKETDVAPVTEKKKAVRKPKRNVSIVELPSTPKSPTAASSSSTPQVNGKAMMTPKRTFLASLAPTTPTSVSHPEAADYKKNFKKKKDELAAKLFKMYNSNVFDNRLPEDMSLTWNPRMRGTAGFCYCKRKRDRKGVVTRGARIVLSPKVVDRPDRLRDTLIHEMCHAAAWLIDGVIDKHGPLWIEWTRKARLRFPELPAIKRCHSYDIDSKFVYKCAKCGYCVKRHSKSLDMQRKRCGKCLGPFELFTKKKKPGTGENPELDLTKTLRAPNAFALFVKENYRVVKETHPEMKHPQIMKIISAQYAVYKSVVTPCKK